VIWSSRRFSVFSEAGCVNIRRADAVHPVSALQSEYSAPFQRPLPQRHCAG
jgi:hypothetical protein